MKALKEYLNEDFFKNVGSTPEDNKKRKTIPLIEEWLKKYNIKNYAINKDLTIDIDGGVDLGAYPEKEFPEYIQFNFIDGWFNLEQSKITSLRGCPIKVNYQFYCNNCNKLTSLEGGPKWVGKDFDCSDCDNLSSLEGAPEFIGGNFLGGI